MWTNRDTATIVRATNLVEGLGRESLEGELKKTTDNQLEILGAMIQSYLEAALSSAGERCDRAFCLPSEGDPTDDTCYNHGGKFTQPPAPDQPGEQPPGSQN